VNISLSFKMEFAPLVESGEKRQTIRMRGKRYAEPGDILHLFTGMRTKQCRKLADVKCVIAVQIYVDTVNEWILARHFPSVKYSYGEAQLVARADGFKDQDSFFAFFRQQYGDGIHAMQLYRW
jgi:hypothetical protein